MKASELIAALTEAIRQSGDCEVTVYDGAHEPDLCHAGGVSTDKTDAGTTYFEIFGHDFFQRYTPKAPAQYAQDADRIVKAVSKARAANSPFLSLLPKNE